MLIHIPDKGFQQIRYYSLYSNKKKAKPNHKKMFRDEEIQRMKDDLKWEKALLDTYGYTPLICKCGAKMEVKNISATSRKNEKVHWQIQVQGHKKRKQVLQRGLSGADRVQMPKMRI